MLKVHTAKTAAFFIAASALMPSASIAIEDCGTSVTECRMKQQIKDLQRQVDELKAKTDAFSVSSGGNVGIGTMSPQATLDIYEPDYGKTGFQVYSDNAHFSWTNHALSLNSKKGWGRVPYIEWVKNDGTRQAYMGWQPGYFNLMLENGHHFSINGGNVGIGTNSPQYKLDVSGTIRGKNLTPSDQRYKQNIHPLDNAITKRQGLRGVSFEWKKSQDQEAGTQIGLIAQDVESVLPELVSTDGDGYKSIAYGQLSAVLIEAVKEQQQIIEQKSATIAELQENHAVQAERMADLQLSLQEQQKENAARQENQAAQAEKMASLEAMMQEMARQVAALKRETVAQPVVQTHLSVSP